MLMRIVLCKLILFSIVFWLVVVGRFGGWFMVWLLCWCCCGFWIFGMLVCKFRRWFIVILRMCLFRGDLMR